MSVDPFPSQGVFARELGLPYPLLSDWPRYQTCRDYGVWRDDRPVPPRVTYVIDKQGIIRGVIASEMDMEVHAREALRIVRELAAQERGQG